MNRPCFCRFFFLRDWHHKQLKNMENTSMDFQKVRTRKIIPYCMILITGLSLVRKKKTCKIGKVYILHARHTFPFPVYIFFKQDFKVFYFLNIIVFK